MPRPDDDQLSLRDAQGFGDWFESPQPVEPLYRALKESDAGPRRTWRVDSSASRLAAEFVTGDGPTRTLPLGVSGDVVLDARNLDLSRGTVHVVLPDLGVPLPVDRVHVDILGAALGTAPREVGARAVGEGRIRLRAGSTSLDLEGTFEVRRVAADRIEVVLHDFPGLDLPTLGLQAALGPLRARWETAHIEHQASANLRLVLAPAPDQTSSSP